MNYPPTVHLPSAAPLHTGIPDTMPHDMSEHTKAIKRAFWEGLLCGALCMLALIWLILVWGLLIF